VANVQRGNAERVVVGCLVHCLVDKAGLGNALIASVLAWGKWKEFENEQKTLKFYLVKTAYLRMRFFKNSNLKISVQIGCQEIDLISPFTCRF
jgi:hypothetical protein